MAERKETKPQSAGPADLKTTQRYIATAEAVREGFGEPSRRFLRLRFVTPIDHPESKCLESIGK